MQKALPNTVLVAEDDPGTREVIRLIVEGAGYRVLEAVDGLDAMEAVFNNRPDLVLLDVRMPEMHGYAVCHRIKSDEALKNTKVVILTAKTFAADRRQAEQVGADAFLSKPLNPPLILEKIKTLLSA